MRKLSTLPDARDWPELWLRASAASRRLLVLDFDGTLAPFSVARDAAQLGAGPRATLLAIGARGETSLGIVSGRRLEEIEERFEGIPAHLVGEHGWDERLPDGTRRRHALPTAARSLLAEVAATLGERLPPGRLEIKRASLVVHTRGERPETVDALRRATSRACRSLRHRAELELRDINGGWELRSRGRHKGTALLSILATLDHPAFTVYLGDDETDEDAFAAVCPRGFGVCVGLDDRPTRAQARVPDVAAVLEFLGLWAGRFASAEAEHR